MQHVFLRILSGLHAGAQAPITQGEELHLGSGNHCHFLLLDPDISEQQASIVCQQAGWNVQINSEPAQAQTEEGQAESELPKLLPFGEVVDIGAGVSITLCQDEYTPIDEKAITPGVEDSPTSDKDYPTENTTTTAQNKTTLIKKIKGWFRIVYEQKAMFFLVIIIIILSLQLFRFAEQYLFSSEPELLPELTSQSPAQALNALSLQQLNLKIQQLHLPYPLQISINQDNRLSLYGWVKTPEQAESLSLLINRYANYPIMTIYIEDQAIHTAQTVLKPFKQRMNITRRQNGVFRLQGLALDQNEKTHAGELILDNLVGLSELENKLMTPEVAVQRIKKLLSKYKLRSQISVDWQQNQIVFSGKLIKTNTVLQWERFLLDFSAQYQRTIPFRTELQSPTAQNTPSGLPFRIRGAVGGDSPYVVLQDGSMLLLGGSKHGYRLDAINDDTMVFSGKSRVVIPR